MDFSLPYTEQQESFRQEVRSWLEENIPEEMKEPVDGREFTKEQYLFWRAKHKELAAKGWLYPTYPKEYGGGGLTGDHETIIEEEFTRARAAGRPSAGLILSTLLVWATEEQKQKFLVPLLSGEKSSWQKFTEPKGGADLANYQSRAVRDGDDWLLTGSNVFVSGRPRPEWESGPDYLWGPMMTDTDAPRHRNLGYFMIPNPSSGLDIKEQALLNGHDQHAIFLDNVRVPGDHLIGGDHQGWQVTSTTLEQEHGGRGQAFPRDEAVDNLVKFTRDTKMGNDPVAQQGVMESLIDVHRNTLLAKRTYWMYQSRMNIDSEGNVANVHGRESDMRNARRIREVMGMYAFLGTQEPDAPFGGKQEVGQRSAAGQRHAGGSTNIAKVVLARRIGISRTQERAAPTPSTATKHGS
jgi:alkylation response protein AidB-like acyl-CoA dehydrogenase